MSADELAERLARLREQNWQFQEELENAFKESPWEQFGLPGLPAASAAAAPPEPTTSSTGRRLLLALGVLSATAAAAGSSGTGQSAQQEAALNRYFPRALSSTETDRRVAQTLATLGYTAQNTLFATSTCPDEVNSKPGELVSMMSVRWGENFALGGLGGVPFTGKSGFAAYAHHAPDQNGKMLIVFAPHVGVEYDGKVGALRRVNQGGVSTACGAAIGAYNAIMKEALAERAAPAEDGRKAADAVPTPEGASDYFDAQITYIKSELSHRLDGVDQAADPIAFTTYMMYEICREFFVSNVVGAGGGFWEDAQELAVLGGIMVNTAKGGDRFMPLLFQTRTDKPGTSTDLYKQTFGGPPPDLSAVLGDSAVAARFHDFDLDTVATAR